MKGHGEGFEAAVLARITGLIDAASAWLGQHPWLRRGLLAGWIMIACGFALYGHAVTQTIDARNAAMLEAWHAHRAEHCEATGMKVRWADRWAEVWRCVEPDFYVRDTGRDVPFEVKDQYKELGKRVQCQAAAEVFPWRTACSLPEGPVRR